MQKMRYFTEAEFRDWAEFMHEEILTTLDRFRELWGAPVQISPAAGSLGRYAGDKMSAHNMTRWGHVYAVDIFPAGMHGMDNMARAANCAWRAGAFGIGLYADTTLNGTATPMMHLDMRPDREKVASWARINHKYKAITDLIPAGWDMAPPTGEPSISPKKTLSKKTLSKKTKKRKTSK